MPTHAVPYPFIELDNVFTHIPADPSKPITLKNVGSAAATFGADPGSLSESLSPGGAVTLTERKWFHSPGGTRLQIVNPQSIPAPTWKLTSTAPRPPGAKERFLPGLAGGAAVVLFAELARLL